MSHILLASHADAADLRDRVSGLLADLDAELHTDLAFFPEPWERAVVLVLLSPRALVGGAVADFVREAGRRGLPLVPLVEDLATYDFSAVPLPELGPLNAAGWQPGDGRQVLEAVRGHLGLAAFPVRKRVFVSYRRADGEEIARRVHRYLLRHGYEPFLDTLQIEAGAVVQERIVQEIAARDFILLIDTPQARNSRWVRAEIIEALHQRIPVRALAVGQDDPYPLMPDVERLVWTPGDRHMLHRLADFVSRGIGASASFDERCRRVLRGLSTARGFRLEERGRRRVLVHAGQRRVLVEYERSAPSLERLHRLYLGHKGTRGAAVLIAGENPLAEPTIAAIAWARGRAPLEVVALHEVASVLDVLLA